MLERIPALRIDSRQATMRVVEIDERANWQSNKGEVVTIHICVKYDVRDPYPYVLIKDPYDYANPPPMVRFGQIDLVYDGEIASLVVYDWCEDDYPCPEDETGEELINSLN